MAAPLDTAALDQLFRAARSYNGYLDKPVSEDQLRAIWDLMKFGPTSANMSPARLVWCVSPEAKQRIAQYASGTNAAKILAAPATVIIGHDIDFHEHFGTLFPHNPDVKNWFPDQAGRETAAFRNGTLQGAFFIMAARALGLDTGPMSGFDNAKVDADFFAGTTVRSNFISTLGYGDRASVFDRLPRFAFEDANKIL